MRRRITPGKGSPGPILATCDTRVYLAELGDVTVTTAAGGHAVVVPRHDVEAVHRALGEVLAARRAYPFTK